MTLIANIKSKGPLLGYDLIRIYLGIGLIIKGIQFIVSPETLSVLLNESQFKPLSMFSLFYIPVCHLLGGAMVTVGFLTRLAALIQVPILFGAVFFVHFNEVDVTISVKLQLFSCRSNRGNFHRFLQINLH